MELFGKKFNFPHHFFVWRRQGSITVILKYAGKKSSKLFVFCVSLNNDITC